MLTKDVMRKRAQRAYPKLEECERCGATENLQRHHPDPNDALFVNILCQGCHTEDHLKDGSWGQGRKKIKTCVNCGKPFSNYSHTRVKTCGKNCLSELGRQNAYKRWHPESTDSEDSGTR